MFFFLFTKLAANCSKFEYTECSQMMLTFFFVCLQKKWRRMSPDYSFRFVFLFSQCFFFFFFWKNKFDHHHHHHDKNDDNVVESFVVVAVWLISGGFSFSFRKKNLLITSCVLMCSQQHIVAEWKKNQVRSKNISLITNLIFFFFSKPKKKLLNWKWSTKSETNGHCRGLNHDLNYIIIIITSIHECWWWSISL